MKNNSSMENNGAINHDSSFFYQIEKARNGLNTLTLNNKTIHSKFHPDEEALNFIKPGKNLILLFGCGLGYPLSNIIKNNPDSLLIAVEPAPDCFHINQLLIQNDLSLFQDQILLLDQTNTDVIYRFLELHQFFSEGRLHYYSNPGYHTLFPDMETLFFTTVKNIFQTMIQNIMTESTFISLWARNFIRNMNCLTKIPYQRILPAADHHSVCVIACAGPTLMQDIPAIRDNRDKITLICVDTAIKPLRKAGIKPDIAVSLDGQFYSLDDFIPDDQKDTAYIFDMISYPQSIELVKNAYFSLTANLIENNLISYFLKDQPFQPTPLDTGGTVSDYCMDLAISLGFKKIYFSGLDLSFPELLTHSRGTPYHDRLLSTTDYFHPFYSTLISTISRRSIKDSWSRLESPVISDFVLENYANYFSNTALNFNHIQFFCSSTPSIRIEGFQLSELQQILAGSRRYNHHVLLKKEEQILIHKNKITHFQKTLLNSLFELSERLKKELEETDFTSEDLSRTHLWIQLMDEIYLKYPFLKKFLVMTILILEKKGINQNMLIYYKHTGFKLLQSLYFLIRTLQKTLKYP